MTNSINPKTHRFIQTRTGSVAIPREQLGTPLSEYFTNAEFPENLGKAVVYKTDDGPVVAKADPVPWNDQHSERARGYASNIKGLIDEKGYYKKNMNLYAERLAEETGRSRDEVKVIISDEFQNAYGKTPFNYLQDYREERGLPTKTDQERQHSQEIE